MSANKIFPVYLGSSPEIWYKTNPFLMKINKKIDEIIKKCIITLLLHLRKLCLNSVFTNLITPVAVLRSREFDQPQRFHMGRTMNFKVGDKAVYPAHGVGVIKRVETKVIGGEDKSFYVLQILSSGATLMIPTDGIDRAGMRKLIDNKEIKKIFKIIKSEGKIASTTWNRRFREFNDKLRTGQVSDVAEVLRDLNTLQVKKDLSLGEKKMMDKAKSLIVSEISHAMSKDESDVEKELSRMLG